MKRLLAAALLAIVMPAQAALLTINEGFDNLAASGWTIVNASNPLGSTSWFQGNAGIFAAQSGAANSYAAANFNATDPGGGTISVWLISPEIQFNFQVLSFYTRAASNLFDDGLRVMLSTSGASTNLGDFSELFNVNGANATGAYPDAWTQFATQLLVGAGTGRIAFQYSVSARALGDYIGIDTVAVRVPEPATLALAALALVAFALARRRAPAR
jgi:hypothetical protein